MEREKERERERGGEEEYKAHFSHITFDLRSSTHTLTAIVVQETFLYVLDIV